MFIIKKHIVPKNAHPSLLTKYAEEIFDEFPTSSSIKKGIKKGLIRLNGNKAKWNARVEPNAIIELVDLESKPIKPLDININIIYEDNEIALINKPSGIEVSGNKYYTIQNAIVDKLEKSNSPDILNFPRPVHRLDYGTSGLLLIAKTRSSRAKLGLQFENRLISKTYLALVAGKLEGNGLIKTPVYGQEAITEFHVMSVSRSIKTKWITKVVLHPLTGRKHQLRVHLTSIGHQIIGDRLYGKEPFLKGKGIFLSSIGIKFTHPITNKVMDFTIDPPAKFDSFIGSQQRNWEKHNTNVITN